MIPFLHKAQDLALNLKIGFIQQSLACFVLGEFRAGNDGQGCGLALDPDIHDQYVCPPVESAQRHEQETHRLVFPQWAGASCLLARLDFIGAELVGQRQIQGQVFVWHRWAD